MTIRANSTSKEYFSLKSKDRQDIKTTTSLLLLKTFTSNGQARGRVIDSKSGKPLALATVRLSNQKTQSSASGFYGFGNTPVGTFTITVDKTGYQDGRRRITVNTRKTSTAISA